MNRHTQNYVGQTTSIYIEVILIILYNYRRCVIAINLNSCVISGTVIEDPQVVGVGDSAWALFKMVTVIGVRNPDGSYTDVDQVVQIAADIPHHVNTIKSWVKANKALAVNGYYRTWEAQGQTYHAFFVSRLTFAKANRGGDADGAPPLPAQ